MLPSEVTMRSYRGYRHNVFEGWKKLDDTTIIGEGYTVEFFRLSESTIDMMCDALNGWYNIWSKFRCEYVDDQGKLSITVRKPEDADKLYRMLSDIQSITFEHEGTTPAVEVARTRMHTIIDLIRNNGKEVHSHG